MLGSERVRESLMILIFISKLLGPSSGSFWLTEASSSSEGIIGTDLHTFFLNVLAQIERRRSNFHPGFFGAFVFKFKPNMTVIIKNLAQKVDLLTKCRSNQDCCSICSGTVSQ